MASMRRVTIAGISRGDIFSPNHIGNDAAIFSMTAQHLRDKGCIVNEYSEFSLHKEDIQAPYIFNMVRDFESMRVLQKYEQEGRFVVNSAFGIENCTREKMTRLLLNAGISHPLSLFLPTNTDPGDELRKAGLEHCWIKRGDFHAIHREDVTYVRNPQEAGEILKEYARRGIPTAVINEHLAGDLIKFYGVSQTGFFHWFYPSVNSHSKFGLEQINGTAQGFSFDPEQLQSLCDKAAEILNVRIYGGDCIVSENGTVRLIDFNDWPSFAPCREEASKAIAHYIYNSITRE